MIDLLPFCSKDEGKPSIEKPFSWGKFTYATNGRLIIRVDHRPDTDRSGMLMVPSEKGVTDIFKQFRDGPWEKLTVEIPGPHKFECTQCGGDSHECGECDGKGRWTDTPSVLVGNKIIDSQYLALIKSLPNLEINPNSGDPKEALSFRFDGGIGILAPMTKHKKMGVS